MCPVADGYLLGAPVDGDPKHAQVKIFMTEVDQGS